LKAEYKKYILEFKRPSGTSRGVLKTKETWFLKIVDGENTGIGECGILRSLSYDDRPDYEDKLQWTCQHIAKGKDWLWQELMDYPSIQMGVEMAFMSLEASSSYVLFPSDFTQGEDNIAINGLIWMGDEDFMKSQVSELIDF